MASGKSLLLFDGECNFCNGTVLFVLDRDPHERIQFASLQSELGQRKLREHGLPLELNTVVLIDEANGAHVRSDAALQLTRRLRWPWPLLYVLALVPRVLRDAAYRWFASHRYDWFGKADQCRVPTPELRRRML